MRDELVTLPSCMPTCSEVSYVTRGVPSADCVTESLGVTLESSLVLSCHGQSVSEHCLPLDAAGTWPPASRLQPPSWPARLCLGCRSSSQGPPTSDAAAEERDAPFTPSAHPGVVLTTLCPVVGRIL